MVRRGLAVMAGRVLARLGEAGPGAAVKDSHAKDGRGEFWRSCLGEVWGGTVAIGLAVAARSGPDWLGLVGQGGQGVSRRVGSGPVQARRGGRGDEWPVAVWPGQIRLGGAVTEKLE